MESAPTEVEPALKRHAESERVLQRRAARESRDLSYLSRVLSRTVEPFGFLVSPGTRARAGDLVFTPAAVIIPKAPAIPNEVFRADFTGIIAVGDDDGAWGVALSLARHAIDCHFALRMRRARFEFATFEGGWAVSTLGIDDVIEIFGVRVRLWDLVR